mgnify:CR=1 FL=1
MCGGMRFLCSLEVPYQHYRTPSINYTMDKKYLKRLSITVLVTFIFGWEGFTSDLSNINHYWSFNISQIWGVFTLWCFFVWKDLSEFHKTLLKLSPYEHVNDTSNSTNLLGQVGIIFTICSLIILFKYVLDWFQCGFFIHLLGFTLCIHRNNRKAEFESLCWLLTLVFRIILDFRTFVSTDNPIQLRIRSAWPL